MPMPAALSSWSGFHEFIKAPQAEIQDDESTGHRWSNVDLDPSPPSHRLWTTWSYLGYWLSFAASSSSITSASAVVATGLSPVSTWLAISFAHVLLCALIIMNGRGPAVYHIGFPVLARQAFGLWGSYFALLFRCIWCIIFCATTSYYASLLVGVSITAIWPSWAHLKNHIPVHIGITSTGLAAFFIYYAVMFPISFIHARHLRLLYVVKGYFAAGCMLFYLGWWMHKVPNVGFSNVDTKPLSLTGKTWLVLQAFNVGIGAASSICVNQGDQARYARKPSDQAWSTMIGYPLASAIPSLIGVLVSHATQKVTGTALWNPWDTMSLMLKLEPNNHGLRFAIWLTSITFALSYMTVNLSTNCLPFGADLTAMFPRYMTIRRGQVLCCILGVCAQPWRIITGAKAFLTFTSGYGYWLSPIAAVMMVHYFFLTKGNIDIPALYTEKSRYWYTRGANFRAIGICIVALIPCMPGFAAQINPKIHLSYTGYHFYYLGFVFTYTMTAVIYYVSYLIWPLKPEQVIEGPWEYEAKLNNEAEAAGGAKYGFRDEAGTPSFDEDDKTAPFSKVVAAV